MVARSTGSSRSALSASRPARRARYGHPLRTSCCPKSLRVADHRSASCRCGGKSYARSKLHLEWNRAKCGLTNCAGANKKLRAEFIASDQQYASAVLVRLRNAPHGIATAIPSKPPLRRHVVVALPLSARDPPALLEQWLLREQRKLQEQLDHSRTHAAQLPVCMQVAVHRVFRSGCWLDSAQFCRCASRDGRDPALAESTPTGVPATILPSA